MQTVFDGVSQVVSSTAKRSCRLSLGLTYNGSTMRRSCHFCGLLAKLMSGGIPDDGIHPVDNIQLATGMFTSGNRLERWSNANKTANRGEHCQHCKWHPHRRRRFVRNVYPVAMTTRPMIFRSDVCTWLMTRTISCRGQDRVVRCQPLVEGRRVRFICFSACLFFKKSFFAPEGHRHQARHVEGSAGGRDGADKPDQPAKVNVISRRRLPENLILGPEAAERNDAANRQPAGEEGPVRVGHVLLQTAHAPHVLLVVHAVNHAAGAEKHERFKERVRHYMEDADDKSTHATGHEHETQLRNSRVGKYLLNIVLGDTDSGGKDRRCRTHQRDN